VDTVWTALKTLLAHPWRWMLARWPWRRLVAWWAALKWAKRRTWQRRWTWGRRWALWAVGALAIILGLGWLGLWAWIGALLALTANAFESVQALTFADLDPTRRVEALRNLLWGLSVVAGTLVAIVTLGFAAWRTWNDARRADTERRKLETETFATAMEQLGNKDFAIRLGAILNLETLARDSRRLHQPIVEAFCAYLREKTRAPSPLLPKGWVDDLRATTKLNEEEFEFRQHVDRRVRQALKPIKSFRTDLQVIVTALGRRTATQDRPGYCLGLRGATLRKADLRNGQFQGADLWGAHLEGATLRGAHLEGATLRGAHLEGVRLWDAHLEGANLRRAHLEGADLWGAHLEGAFLWRAHLEGTVLLDAHLEGASLTIAHLEGADLEDAHLEGANLEHAHLEGANLEGANLEGASLEGAHLKGAHLKGAHLEGADLRGTNVTQDQLNSADGDTNTQIPDPLTRPAHWT